MTIDFNKLRERLDKLRAKGEKKDRKPSSEVYFKINKGQDKIIRIVDYPHADDPFVETWHHYNIGPIMSVYCPKYNHGGKCPICDAVSKLYETGLPRDKELAGRTRARARYFSPIIDRTDSEFKLRWWGYPPTVFDKLIDHALDPDYQDGGKCLTDLDKGRDITVSKPLEDKKAVNIKVKPKSSKAHSDAKELEAAIAELPDLHENPPWKIYSEDELFELVKNLSNSSGEGEETKPGDIADLRSRLGDIVKPEEADIPF